MASDLVTQYIEHLYLSGICLALVVNGHLNDTFSNGIGQSAQNTYIVMGSICDRLKKKGNRHVDFLMNYASQLLILKQDTTIFVIRNR